MLGKLLRGSGWEWAMTKADIFTSGRTASTLDENHIKRSRYAHQVSLVAFAILQDEAYSAYCISNQGKGPNDTIEMWACKQAEKHPMPFYWQLVMNKQKLLLRFVRSLREGDFQLYVQVCDELGHMALALDLYNYSRDLPTHTRDMVLLPTRHPAVYQEFLKGNFVVQRSTHRFSLMAKDQSHEHSNKELQQNGGGLSDLYDHADSIALYMLAAPDTARMIKEFEHVLCKESPRTTHHEESPKLQIKFLSDVRRFMDVLRPNNPFLDEGENLKRLDTRDVMEPEVISSYRNLDPLGEALHDSLDEHRFVKCDVPYADTVHKNSLYSFSNRPDNKNTQPDKYKALKQSTVLITQMFMSLQSRPNPDENIKCFMSHENSREPPSLSDHGFLRSGTKSAIIDCLKAPKGIIQEVKQATAILLDMAPIIHMLAPTRCAKFNEYVPVHVAPYIKGISQPNGTRIDLLWDEYPDENLKSQTHILRGSGPRTELGDDGETPIPRRDWQRYLANKDNTKELFSFLSKQLVSNAQLGDILMLSTLNDMVLINKPYDYDSSRIQPSNHIEADTRIFMHLAHAAHAGHTKAYIRTVDSDIVVLAVAFFNEIATLTHLWIGFGTGKHYRDIPIHDICKRLTKDEARALPFFHALTGCDTNSQPVNIGKKTAWDRWGSMPEMTQVFLWLLDNPEKFTMNSWVWNLLERYLIVQCSKSCSSSRLNDARLKLFQSGTKTLENLPPTSAAYFQHVKRAILQASFFWKQSLTPQQVIPNYALYGWKYDERVKQWVPHWTDLADTSTACAFLVKCGCKKACHGNCKCFKAGLRCSALCGCQGGCTNNNDDNE